MKRASAFLRQYVLPVIVCFGAAFILTLTPQARRLEDLTMDERTRLRARFDLTVPLDELALVCIDETSIREVGRWPWPRKYHAEFLRATAQARPAVVSWDILFTEPTEDDLELAQAARANRSVVFGAMRESHVEDGVSVADAVADGVKMEPLTRIEGDVSAILASPAMSVPLSPLGRVTSNGFVDTPPGDDGIRRAVPLIVRVGEQVYPTLSLRTLMEYWGADATQVTVRLGDSIQIEAPLARRRIPIDRTGAYLVNYRHSLTGFVRYGYTTTLSALTHRYVRREPTEDVPAVSGRMLLVGQTADGLADFGPTPFSPLTPLMLVHANVIENVVREDYPRRVAPVWPWAAMALLGVVGLARFSTRAPREQAVFSAGVPLVFVYVATMAWINDSRIVPVVGPLTGFIALQVFMIGRRMLTELRAKEQIKGMFSSYVSPALVSRLVAAGKPPQLGGHAEEITAYFSDIQDFSTFSEVLPPPQLVELINEYLTECTDLLQAEGGTLDKYIGDAVVAMFGAPVRLPDHAYRACVTALNVQRKLDELRAKWTAEGRWPELVCHMRSRIGLNTGTCVIGNMGSRTRFNYTMMGDDVNLAARMESGAKSWGAYSVCTEATRQACEVHGPGRILFRPLGRVIVKGRSAAVPIHEIVGFRSEATPPTSECVEVFSAALQRFYAREWDEATKGFQRSAKLEPLIPGISPGVKRNPSLVYIDRVAKYKSDPPAADWTGVHVMTEK